MKEIARIRFYLLACALGLFFLDQAGSACQVDDFFLTKDGYLAGSTPDNLSEAVKCQEKGNLEKLAAMMKNGSVIKLRENIKVCALERSFEYRMIKIRFPDNETAYWVKEEALKRIDSD